MSQVPVDKKWALVKTMMLWKMRKFPLQTHCVCILLCFNFFSIPLTHLYRGVGAGSKYMTQRLLDHSSSIPWSTVVKVSASLYKKNSVGKREMK